MNEHASSKQNKKEEKSINSRKNFKLGLIGGGRTGTSMRVRTDVLERKDIFEMDGEGCILATKNPLDGKFSSIPCLLDLQGSGEFELSFFWVIVVIRFRLTRNDIISFRSVNLIVIVIDGTVQHRRFIRNHLCYRCNMFWQSCCICVMWNWNILLLDMLEFNKNMIPFLR
ncbi:hypothetical protein M9H77_26549 [Catharanthus roseus]|uniref:Uncharacterized protein n=1 Tax=Catharanthus roseus TaxID=4058 RepID=A0ACC0AAZ6_CATRO|nr:hypothetical protein M9H77_26549 [Catharanthus roseus]